ncbi:hypothetical protein NECAME_06707 [Necator americanus]|uniref:Uncharacterized protein n=1 Tax=Necator americanus TaxID=51031 RepID=W2TSF7_NECAM|nr:hypothetical protein NECAME_06707 [Necator americanus]ETN84743.1 hypothetical protein NECAME_06707 [Necator americanus]
MYMGLVDDFGWKAAAKLGFPKESGVSLPTGVKRWGEMADLFERKRLCTLNSFFSVKRLVSTLKRFGFCHD